MLTDTTKAYLLGLQSDTNARGEQNGREIQTASHVAKDQKCWRKSTGWNGLFHCKLCLTHPRTREYLQSHHDSYHRGAVFHILDETPFQCPDCNQRCARAPLLNHHWLRHHDRRSPDGRYECTVCHKQHISSHGLPIHRSNDPHVRSLRAHAQSVGI